MYLVVGLGNPDKKYQNTYHNLGFMVADKLSELLEIQFNKGECCAVTAHTKINGEKIIVAKPTTYMNLSGQAVTELCNKYKIEQGHLIVVYDDVDLPIGSLRIRKEGSAGTHNGMRDIVNKLGTTNFPRIRVGFKKTTQLALIDLVLSQIPQEDHLVLDKVIESAAYALKEFVEGESIDIVMQKHNINIEK